MANNPSTVPGYNGQTAAPDANYTYGSAKDDAAPGDLTGTPRIAAEINDIMGLQQKLLNAAGIIPSGNPDTVLVSQYFEALGKLFAGNGVLVKSVAGGANVTLTDAESINGILRLTGVVTANIALIVPDTKKSWVVINDTTGAFVITVRTVSGTGFAMQQNMTATLRSDGTNVVTVYTDRQTEGHTTGGGDVADGPNVIAGHLNNSIAPDVHSCTISGGGQLNNENVIGGIAANVFNSGVSNVDPSGITGTQSRYCVIGGGYDNVCNGLANIITGMHCVIDILDIGFDANHCTISGGSLHKILAGPYNVISGGTQNEVLARAGYSVIGGGGANKINQSAQYSVIGGGNENQTSDLYSTIGGGNTNIIDAIQATISGGAGNTTTQDNSTIAGGNNGVISGLSQGSTIAGGINGLATAESSTVLAGRDNSSLANHTISSGFEAKAERAGQKAWAVGKFAVQGDAQTSVIILKISTTDATPTNLQDISVGVSFPFKADINIGYNIRIVGHRTDVQGDNIVIILEGMAHRASSGSWLIVDFADKIASTAGSASWSARIFDSVGSLRVEVTGEAAKDINWIANVEYTENQG